MFEKLKSLLADDALFMALLMILVSIVSFGLGKHSVADVGAGTQAAGVVFIESEQGPQKEATLTSELNSVQLVGSRSGTKYHLPNCPGAAQIKEENRIYFNSRDQAEAAGYAPAANCPGL